MEKRDYKKYLISIFGLLSGGFLISFFLIYVLTENGMAHTALSLGQMIGAALGCAVIPAGSFAGLVFFGTRAGELNKRRSIFLIVLFPLLLAIVTALGIILIIPSIVDAFNKIIRG